MSSTIPTLALPYPILTKIIGQPTNTSITLLTKEIYANALTIPSLRGGGAHGHLGFVMDATAYQQHSTTAFALPAHPGATPNHPPGATSAQIQESIRAFNALVAEHSLAITVREELKKQLLLAVDQLYLAALEDPIFGFANVTLAAMLNHLTTTYGTLSCSDLEKNRASIRTLWTPTEPIERLWERLREVRRIATAGADPIADSVAINLTHLLFEATGVFTHACETWLTRPAANKTMTEFQTFFNAANKERLRRLTTSQAGFHSANVTATDTTQAGFHSANATATDKTRAATPPAPPVTVTTPGLTTSNDGSQVFYCWTHGLGFNKNHTSATCSNPAEGHCQTATLRNMRGGNNNIMSGRRRPKPDTTKDAATKTDATTKAT